MKKTATELWGVQSSDLAAFDPVIELLFGASAVELEKVYQEIYSSNARVLERLSKLLLPDVYKNTLPAHSIVYTKPYMNNAVLNKYAQFVYVKKVAARESSVRENQQEIFFSPVNNFKLIKGELKYLANNNSLHAVEDLIYKRTLSNARLERDAKFLWIGIELSEPLKEYEDIVLYFDWLNDPRKEKYFEFLHFTNWSFNGINIPYSIGPGISSEVSSAKDVFNYDSEYVVSQTVMQYYSKRYITLKTASVFVQHSDVDLCPYPPEFAQLYDPSELKKMNQNCLWLKCEFPSFFTTDSIDDAVCQINAFPVINRKLNELNYRLVPESLFIIPLKDKNADESFFAIESVKSADGKPYISGNISELNELNNGSYVIRKGGVQRFDQRNAREYLNYMVDLLRDESAAFSVFAQEMLSSDITQLNQTLSRIEQKVQRSVSDEHTLDYLILRSYLNQDNVYIEYWSTSGEAANNINVGSSLNLYRGDDIDASSIVIMSKSTGGKDELTASEMLTAFKKSLTSRDRIITIADIKNLCYSELGAIIKDVTVKKEFTVAPGKKTGFQRVIKVELTPADKNLVDENQWSMHKLQLESVIKNSSLSDVPIEIVVKNPKP